MDLLLKILRKFVMFILMVTSGAPLGGSPSPTEPLPFLKSMKYLPDSIFGQKSDTLDTIAYYVVYPILHCSYFLYLINFRLNI